MTNDSRKPNPEVSYDCRPCCHAELVEAQASQTIVELDFCPHQAIIDTRTGKTLDYIIH